MTLFHRWLAGEPIAIRSRRVLSLRTTASALAIVMAVSVGGAITRKLRNAPPVPALPADEGDARFGVPLEKRRAVFARLAAVEPMHRAAGHAEFAGPGLEWSAEDHRAAFERGIVAAVASEESLDPSQVYAILDEGIRAHWPGPDGEPLSPTTVPLHPRRSYGW